VPRVTVAYVAFRYRSRQSVVVPQTISGLNLRFTAVDKLSFDVDEIGSPRMTNIPDEGSDLGLAAILRVVNWGIVRRL